MEAIFTSILNLINREMPELSLVDEDYGQLETAEDTYPVTFPCALIGNMEADWEEIGMGTQKGVVTLTARLAIDCYDDTHIDSGTTKKRKHAYGWQTACIQYCSVHATVITWDHYTARKQDSIRSQV